MPCLFITPTPAEHSFEAIIMNSEENIQELYRHFRKHPCIATDTRKDVEDCVFFALKGENFDANNFAEDARAKGAALVVTQRPDLEGRDGFFYVPDTLKALQDLARFHRRQMAARILAVTGSNGKTTTKELMAAVLNKKFKVLATQGNLNNHIGVPLTLLRLQPGTQWAVVEMGTNHPGEIAALCAIAEPDYGYITGFGEAHLEFFKNLEGVVREKTALYRALKSHGGTAIIDWDDERQRRHTEGMERFGYSFAVHPQAQIHVEALHNGPFAGLRFRGTEIGSQLVGDFHARNMAGALAAGVLAGVDLLHIKAAIEDYRPANNRSQWIRRGDLNIILDAYNANPTSVRAALESLRRLPGPHTAVLGDMLELGPDAVEMHRRILQVLAGTGISVYVIGPLYGQAVQTLGERPEYVAGVFSTTEDFIRSGVFHRLTSGSVWIKGSRGMALERILQEG